MRSAAAIALGQLGDVAADALPALFRVLRTHSVSRDVTASVIAQLGEDGEKYLRKCVVDANLGVAVRVSAAKGLASVPTRVLHCCKRADAIARALCKGIVMPTPKLRSACLKVRAWCCLGVRFVVVAHGNRCAPRSLLCGSASVATSRSRSYGSASCCPSCSQR